MFVKHVTKKKMRFSSRKEIETENEQDDAEKESVGVFGKTICLGVVVIRSTANPRPPGGSTREDDQAT